MAMTIQTKGYRDCTPGSLEEGWTDERATGNREGKGGRAL